MVDNSQLLAPSLGNQLNDVQTNWGKMVLRGIIIGSEEKCAAWKSNVWISLSRILRYVPYTSIHMLASCEYDQDRLSMRTRVLHAIGYCDRISSTKYANDEISILFVEYRRMTARDERLQTQLFQGLRIQWLRWSQIISMVYLLLITPICGFQIFPNRIAPGRIVTSSMISSVTCEIRGR